MPNLTKKTSLHV